MLKACTPLFCPGISKISEPSLADLRFHAAGYWKLKTSSRYSAFCSAAAMGKQERNSTAARMREHHAFHCLLMP
jgi:hypothetical protein